MQEKGCVEKIRSSYKFVNIIFGTHNIYKLAELVCLKLAGEDFVCDVWDKPKDIVELKICRLIVNTPINPASISCTDAIISVHTA